MRPPLNRDASEAAAAGNLAASARRVIGAWEVDPATNALHRDGKTVRLEPRAMDVLVELSKRPGEVLGRDALLAAAWPGLVVGDEALTQCIAKLRRALGDDPKSPAYIETISKRGYRLLAPVTPPGLAAASPPLRPTAPRRHRIAGVVALTILLAGAFAYFVAAPQGAGEGNAPPRVVAPVAEPATVAVLPFESLGPGDTQAYLARGISDGLLTELGRLSQLRTIRVSGGSPAGPAARSARYLVSGSVQREGERLRIHVHLLDTRTGEQLWSERFERSFGDLFSTQDEILRKLTEALPARLSEAERARLSRRHTRSLDAYDHFLQAQALFLARGPEANLEARALYRKALELDPKFARAYAGLAMTHALEHRLRGSEEARRGLERGRELAETARQIDADIPEVHWALGFVHVQARRHEEAKRSLQKAIELNPSFADAYALMGGIHAYTGDPAQGIALLRTAMRYNPEAGYLHYQALGRAYLLSGDVEQALINLREAVVRNPADLETRVLLAAALTAAGDVAAARWEAQEARNLEPGLSPGAWLDAYPLVHAPHRERLAELLRAAGL